MRAVTTARMREIDEAAIRQRGIPSLHLMENAASAVAEAVGKQLADDSSPAVTVVCGTGNNGGDGLACARLLLGRGIPVTVYLVGNPAKLTPDAAENLHRLEALGVTVQPYTGQALAECSCIVDAMFGFGLNREVTGLYRTAIEAINAAGSPVVSCDIPSGLNGDTGLPMGTAVKATQTVTFTCPKQGLLVPEAAVYVGELMVAGIGIPEDLV